MAAWRGPPLPHQAETSFPARIEDDEKQKLMNALGEPQGEAGGLQIKECHVLGLRSLLRWKFVTGSFRPFTPFWKPSPGRVKKKWCSSKLTPRDDGADGDVREKLLRQECRVDQSTADRAIFVDGEVVRKPSLRQELEQAAPSIHANVTECHVDVKRDVSTPRSGVGTLYQWFLSVLRCLLCMSSHSTSANSGENIIGYDEAKSDLEEARLQRSIIQLKRKDHLSDVDPINLVSTVFQRSDQSASISDTRVEMPSAEVITNNIESELEAVAEEMITLNLGGPGVLGGLSFLGYKHVVFSVCPALTLVEADLE